mgnify:CR=1 FL=1
MRRTRFPFLTAITAISVLGMAGCKPSPEQQEQEIERRVAQRLEEERLAQQKKALEEKEQELARKEAELAAREAAGAATPGATPAPVPSSAATPEPEVQYEPQDNSYDAFYSALDRDGEWIETPEYGTVWQPYVAQRNETWRPYTLGRWVYTDYGWTWVSDEPFGWAVYHYGRWTRLVGIGWVWVPGHLWAPSWVSWRQTDDYIGWAPLPPESSRADRYISDRVDTEFHVPPSYYIFVPITEFGVYHFVPYIFFFKQKTAYEITV